MADVPHYRMRRDLSDPVSVLPWPGNLRLEEFSQSRAAEAHALLQLSYAQGGGSVPDFAEWWTTLSADAEYDPDLCFLLCGADGAAAFAQCWTSGYIKDLVVHPRLRRRGIGRVLLAHIFHAFQQRGAGAVDLKVHTDNVGAIRLYQSLGMARISAGPTN